MAMLSIGIAACAPQRPPYRVPAPPSTVARQPQVPPPPPQPAATEPPPRVLPPEPKIREQDIRSKSLAPAAPTKDAKEPVKQASLPEVKPEPAPTGPALADDSSMLAKITPATPPHRAASLRLTEEGRKLLDAGDAAKALTRLEKTIVIDAANAYGYFYLAKAQYRLGRHKEASNFLDIAEARLGGEPFWVAEVYALRGDLQRAAGQSQKAEASYQQALRINSANRAASDGLSRVQGEAAVSPK
jgi:hypothetical protein